MFAVGYSPPIGRGVSHSPLPQPERWPKPRLLVLWIVLPRCIGIIALSIVRAHLVGWLMVHATFVGRFVLHCPGFQLLDVWALRHLQGVISVESKTCQVAKLWAWARGVLWRWWLVHIPLVFQRCGFRKSWVYISLTLGFCDGKKTCGHKWNQRKVLKRDPGIQSFSQEPPRPRHLASLIFRDRTASGGENLHTDDENWYPSSGL